MPTTWTNAVAPGAPIRALDVRELRQAIDNNRVAAALGAFQWWTDSVKDGSGNEIGPVAGVPIRAHHLIELRWALQDLWKSKSMG